MERKAFGSRQLLALCFCLVSCSGGGGGGGGGGANQSGQTVTGSVVAPGGQLVNAIRSPQRWFASLWITESFALGGISPVAGATVLLFDIDGQGNPLPLGNPQTLAHAVTDNNGNFSVTLPPPTKSGSGTTTPSYLIAQVLPPGTPAVPLPLCDPASAGCPPGTRLNAPVLQSQVIIDPSTELASRKIIAAGPTNFTSSSAQLYIVLIQNFLAANLNLAGSTIENTITNIKNAPTFQSQVQPTLTAIQNSGQTDQSVIGGTHTFARFHAIPDIGASPLQRIIETGTMMFDPVAGSSTVQSNLVGGQLFETCPTICTRNFTLQASTAPNSELAPIFRTLTGSVLTATSGETLIGQTNNTGNVFIFPFLHNELGFSVALKQGSALTAADAQGIFNEVAFTSRLSQTLTGNSPSWDNPLRSGSGVGTITFAGGNITVTHTDSEMTRTVSCTVAGNPCTINATLPSATPLATNFTVPFKIGSDGTVSFTSPNSGAQTATLSADKTILLQPVANPQSPAFVALRIGLRQATGLTNANLNGTYSVVIFEDIFGTGQWTWSQVRKGTVQFGGNGVATFTTLGEFFMRSECPPPGACTTSGFAQIVTSVIDQQTYTVTPQGLLTFTGGNIPGGSSAQGAVIPDTTFFAATLQENGVALSQPNGVPGPISVRSLILGMKQQ
jgi:hypothetical protein